MIGIVIPTLNRSRFLEKALAFYDQKEFGGMVYIVDSSDGEERKRNEALVEKHCENIMISYRHFNGSHDGAVITQLNRELHEHIKYLTFAGDDDFLVPEGLTKCATFLDENPTYIAAHGQRINFAYMVGKVKLLNVRYGYDWNEEFSQMDRLREYLRVGITLSNYLHRKEAWVERYKVCDEIPTRYLGGELCSECTSALLGKVKFLQDVVTFLFYQDNPERFFSFDRTTLFELMNTPDWAQSYKRLLLRLTELMEVKNMEEMERELYFHIASIISAQYQSKYGLPQDPRLSKNNCDLGELAPEIGQLLNLVGKISFDK